ncbi:hypothetical protein OC845_005063 [Tilletia horrida]|nr:hypothetical protein OC845_005063 [Tilletia horrida]
MDQRRNSQTGTGLGLGLGFANRFPGRRRSSSNTAAATAAQNAPPVVTLSRNSSSRRNAAPTAAAGAAPLAFVAPSRRSSLSPGDTPTTTHSSGGLSGTPYLSHSVQATVTGFASAENTPPTTISTGTGRAVELRSHANPHQSIDKSKQLPEPPSQPKPEGRVQSWISRISSLSTFGASKPNLVLPEPALPLPKEAQRASIDAHDLSPPSSTRRALKISTSAPTAHIRRRSESMRPLGTQTRTRNSALGPLDPPQPAPSKPASKIRPKLLASAGASPRTLFASPGNGEIGSPAWNSFSASNQMLPLPALQETQRLSSLDEAPNSSSNFAGEDSSMAEAPDQSPAQLQDAFFDARSSVTGVSASTQQMHHRQAPGVDPDTSFPEQEESVLSFGSLGPPTELVTTGLVGPGRQQLPSNFDVFYAVKQAQLGKDAMHHRALLETEEDAERRWKAGLLKYHRAMTGNGSTSSLSIGAEGIDTAPQIASKGSSGEDKRTASSPNASRYPHYVAVLGQDAYQQSPTHTPTEEYPQPNFMPHSSAARRSSAPVSARGSTYTNGSNNIPFPSVVLATDAPRVGTYQLSTPPATASRKTARTLRSLPVSPHVSRPNGVRVPAAAATPGLARADSLRGVLGASSKGPDDLPGQKSRAFIDEWRATVKPAPVVSASAAAALSKSTRASIVPKAGSTGAPSTVSLFTVHDDADVVMKGAQRNGLVAYGADSSGEAGSGAHTPVAHPSSPEGARAGDGSVGKAGASNRVTRPPLLPMTADGAPPKFGTISTATMISGFTEMTSVSQR